MALKISSGIRYFSFQNESNETNNLAIKDLFYLICFRKENDFTNLEMNKESNVSNNYYFLFFFFNIIIILTLLIKI